MWRSRDRCSRLQARDRQQLVGTCVPSRQQVGNPMHDHASLTRAGARKDQQRTIDVLRGLALFGIQGLKKIHVSWL